MWVGTGIAGDGHGKTLCGYPYASDWPAVFGDEGKPWNATCDRCRTRRMVLGPGTGPSHPDLFY